MMFDQLTNELKAIKALLQTNNNLLEKLLQKSC